MKSTKVLVSHPPTESMTVIVKDNGYASLIVKERDRTTVVELHETEREEMFEALRYPPRQP